MQGRIAACNVLSDLYALGCDQIDTVLMVLGISLKMNEKQREVVTPLMIAGFDDCSKEAGCYVQGGQTVYNPWPMIGGVGIAAVGKQEHVVPIHASKGEVIVMTKVLGTQIVVNAKQWHYENGEKWQKIKDLITPEQLDKAYAKSEWSMATLNLLGAKLYRKYNGKACTDITGFGVKGHLQNLVDCQKNKVDFILKKLAVIANAFKLDGVVFDFKLKAGWSAETSGGLFCIFAKEDAEKFCAEMIENGHHAMIVGDVVEGTNQAIIDENVEIVEVE